MSKCKGVVREKAMFACQDNSFYMTLGLETLGVESFDKNPLGADIDKISGDTFLKEA